MPDLIPPAVRLHAAWLEARDDWGRGVTQDGSGLRPTDDVDSPAGFAAWVSRLVRAEDPTEHLDEGMVHCTYRWIVEDARVLGAIALRHELNDLLLRAGGHIGYGVRPSARRRGLATWAVGEMLGEARALGLTRLLLTCDVDNVGSRRVIEANGGVLEDVRGEKLRFWVPTR